MAPTSGRRIYLIAVARPTFMKMAPLYHVPIKVVQGTNRLCNMDDAESHFTSAINSPNKEWRIPEFWGGRRAGRVVKSIRSFLQVA